MALGLLLMGLTAVGRAWNVTVLPPEASVETDSRGGSLCSSDREVLLPASVDPSSGSAVGGGVEEGPEPAPEGHKVDINRATRDELEALPGIGPVLAGRILEYRERHGPFRSLDDLLKVKGIGPKTVARIAPFVAVTPP